MSYLNLVPTEVMVPTASVLCNGIHYLVVASVLSNEIRYLPYLNLVPTEVMVPTASVLCNGIRYLVVVPTASVLCNGIRYLMERNPVPNEFLVPTV